MPAEITKDTPWVRSAAAELVRTMRYAVSVGRTYSDPEEIEGFSIVIARACEVAAQQVAEADRLRTVYLKFRDEVAAVIYPAGYDGGRSADEILAMLRARLAAQQVAEADRADGSHLERVHEDDEIVCIGGSFHMERMDDDHIWFQVDGLSFGLYAKRSKLLWMPQASGGWPAVSTLVHPAA